jgi:hypothetical protein
MRQPWNWHLGWLLLLAGFVGAVGLDPWSLSEPDPSALVGSPRMAARHAQGVVLAMGFLQLAVTMLLRRPDLPERGRFLSSWLIGLGSLVYAGGYVAQVVWPGHAEFIVLGAAINLLGFALWTVVEFRSPEALERQAILGVFCLGMMLDIIMGLFALDPSRFLPEYIGPEDGVRQRMLRLARVAAVALSLITLLFLDLVRRVRKDCAWLTRARWAMIGGTIGMPAILAAACFIDVQIKYLLPLPAFAMTGGVVIALGLARQEASRLEQWGWLLIAVSMSIGLFVGLYAFDGPLPAPAFVGTYNDFTRRLMRLGHAYCIVLGLLAILIGRQAPGPLVRNLLVVGTCVTLPAIGSLAILGEPAFLLTPGPALVACALSLLVSRWGLQSRGLQPPSRNQE